MRIITAGLKAGEPVIVKGLQRVRPGQKVEAEADTSKIAAASPAKRPAETKPAVAQPNAVRQER